MSFVGFGFGDLGVLVRRRSMGAIGGVSGVVWSRELTGREGWAVGLV